MPRPRVSHIKERLEAIPKAVREDVKVGLTEAANDLAARVWENVPVHKGDLRDSTYATSPGEHGLRENQAVVTTGNGAVSYASYTEYGTSHEPPHPFFWPTYFANRERLRANIRARISAAVKRAWK